MNPTYAIPDDKGEAATAQFIQAQPAAPYVQPSPYAQPAGTPVYTQPIAASSYPQPMAGYPYPTYAPDPNQVSMPSRPEITYFFDFVSN